MYYAAVICANSCVLRDFSVVFWVLICASSPHCYPVQVITNCCTAKQISAICQALQLPECIPVMQCNVLLVYRARVLFARALVCDFKSLQFAPICNNAEWHSALQCNALQCRVGQFREAQKVQLILQPKCIGKGLSITGAKYLSVICVCLTGICQCTVYAQFKYAWFEKGCNYVVLVKTINSFTHPV